MLNSKKITWGEKSLEERGVIYKNNSIGVIYNNYSVFKALGTVTGDINIDFKPDFNKLNCFSDITIKPNKNWFNPDKIVTLDVFGNYTKKDYINHKNIQPSIAITKANLDIPEITNDIKDNLIPIDGKIVTSDYKVKVYKIAIDKIWYLPGVAKRLNVSEGMLRKTIYTQTGGMYKELIDNPEKKIFIPPIGGSTIYIFGDPLTISDDTIPLTCRVHDECNSSDVFSSDICTCRPYLIYAIKQSIIAAQNGGNGIVIYTRKEGRNLGEITKFLVYNLRKNSQDKKEAYFNATKSVIGTEDCRFQEFISDILLWLGINKIDNLVSMSKPKYDNIIKAGIKVIKRTSIPKEIIPSDAHVEIDAKIDSGYLDFN